MKPTFIGVVLCGLLSPSCVAYDLPTPHGGDGDGDVAVFELSKENTPLGEIPMGEEISSTPVAADDVLYIATRTHLYAIEQR